MVETRAELPFIGDQIVSLNHDQAARSGPRGRLGPVAPTINTICMTFSTRSLSATSLMSVS